MSRLKTLVANQHGVQPLRGGHALCQGCGIPLVVRTVSSTIKRADGRRQCDRLSRGRDDEIPDDGLERAVAPRRVRECRRSRERRRGGAARAPPASRAPRRRGRRSRRLRRRRRHLRHRLAGPLGRTRARPSLPLRLLRQRGLHEHGRPALRRDAVRRQHDHEPDRHRELRQGTAAQRHDGDRRRAPRAVRRAGRVDLLGRPEQQGGARRRSRRAGIPQRPHRLPARLGSRAADSPGSSLPRSRRASGRSTRSSTAVPADLRPQHVRRSRTGSKARRGSPISCGRKTHDSSTEIQARVDRDWAALLARSASDRPNNEGTDVMNPRFVYDFDESAPKDALCSEARGSGSLR